MTFKQPTHVYTGLPSVPTEHHGFVHCGIELTVEILNQRVYKLRFGHPRKNACNDRHECDVASPTIETLLRESAYGGGKTFDRSEKHWRNWRRIVTVSQSNPTDWRRSNEFKSACARVNPTTDRKSNPNRMFSITTDVTRTTHQFCFSSELSHLSRRTHDTGGVKYTNIVYTQNTHASTKPTTKINMDFSYLLCPETMTRALSVRGVVWGRR